MTFQRPTELAASLEAVGRQTRALDDLLVVDNSPDSRTEGTVRRLAPAAEYLAAPENVGPAGGVAIGMARILRTARDEDWIVTLDDDDPPEDPEMFARLVAFASAMSEIDPRTAGVGRSGVRFDHRRGRVVRVPDEELEGAVPVDCVAGNQCPFYAVTAVRAVGGFRAELFFGLEELEFGLRLRAAGYSLYASGDLWLERRTERGRLGIDRAPRRSLSTPTWRRYYSLRNVIYILRAGGHRATALRVTFVVGLAKPLRNLPRRPGDAVRHLRINWRASRDAWTGRMGRTFDPSSTPSSLTAPPSGR